MGPGRRRLSRLHLHTLGYQIIMVRRPVNLTAARQFEESARQSGQPLRASDIGRAWPFARAAAAKVDHISIIVDISCIFSSDSFVS